MRHAKHWATKLGIRSEDVLRIQREAFDHGAEMCAKTAGLVVDRMFGDLNKTFESLIAEFAARVDKIDLPSNPEELEGRP